MALFKVFDEETMDEPLEIEASSFRAAALKYARNSFFEEGGSDLSCDVQVTDSDGKSKFLNVTARLELEIN